MTRPTPALARVFDVLRAGGAASAVDARGEKSTYDDLSARVAGFSSALTSMRHGGRPRVAILSAKCVDAYAATLACVRSGATFCPLNTEAPAARNARILHDFAPDCVFLDPGAELHRIAALDGLPTLRADEGTTLAGARVVRPTDVAYVIYTSGTTGHPKGVQISYSNLDWFLGSSSFGVSRA